MLELEINGLNTILICFIACVVYKTNFIELCKSLQIYKRRHLRIINLSLHAKFFEDLTFFTYVSLSVGKEYSFYKKFYVPTKWMIPRDTDYTIDINQTKDTIIT